MKSRRIQKLYHSTEISAEPAYQNGFELSYSLREGLEDWLCLMIFIENIRLITSFLN